MCPGKDRGVKDFGWRRCLFYESDLLQGKITNRFDVLLLKCFKLCHGFLRGEFLLTLYHNYTDIQNGLSYGSVPAFRSAPLLIQSRYVKQQSTMYDFSTFKKELAQVVDHYKAELSSIRTGRAAPALLDGVRVEAYGSMSPLNQVGSVTIEDARTLRVSAWDQSQVKAIERGIHDANLGVSLSTDEKGVRVSFPELTSERREQLMRLTRSKLEEARTAVRIARDDVWQDIQKKEKDKELSEDEKFNAKENMEKQVKETNETLEQMAKKKEEELNS